MAYAAQEPCAEIDPLDLVRLRPLMQRSSGSPDIVVGLLDGPVATGHPDLAAARIRSAPGPLSATCSQIGSTACQHGTFVAGMLSARRDAPAPAICPGCTLLVCPIFAEATPGSGQSPAARPEELAAAIVSCVGAGAHVLNLSLAVAEPSPHGGHALREALDYAARRGVLIVVAAGNQSRIGGSVILSHPWVIPVTGYDCRGRPLDRSNFGISIGRRGVGAPGEGVTSCGVDGQPTTSGGTSVAAPFVTGTLALLRSEFPAATAAELKLAITRRNGARRTAIVPPLLDAWAACQTLLPIYARR